MSWGGVGGQKEIATQNEGRNASVGQRILRRGLSIWQAAGAIWTCWGSGNGVQWSEIADFRRIALHLLCGNVAPGLHLFHVGRRTPVGNPRGESPTELKGTHYA